MVASHFFGSLSIRPNRMRTPMSDARREEVNNKASAPQRVLSIDEGKDAVEGREDTEENQYSVFSIQWDL